MSETELHWEANHLINTGIYSIQLSIEEYKSELKFLSKQKTSEINLEQESSAIHGLQELRKELQIFEYMQHLLDIAAVEISTVETVKAYLEKASNKKT